MAGALGCTGPGNHSRRGPAAQGCRTKATQRAAIVPATCGSTASPGRKQGLPGSAPSRIIAFVDGRPFKRQEAGGPLAGSGR